MMDPVGIFSLDFIHYLVAEFEIFLPDRSLEDDFIAFDGSLLERFFELVSCVNECAVDLHACPDVSS